MFSCFLVTHSCVLRSANRKQFVHIYYIPCILRIVRISSPGRGLYTVLPQSHTGTVLQAKRCWYTGSNLHQNKGTENWQFSGQYMPYVVSTERIWFEFQYSIKGVYWENMTLVESTLYTFPGTFLVKLGQNLTLYSFPTNNLLLANGTNKLGLSWAKLSIRLAS